MGGGGGGGLFGILDIDWFWVCVQFWRFWWVLIIAVGFGWCTQLTLSKLLIRNDGLFGGGGDEWGIIGWPISTDNLIFVFKPDL